MTRHVTRGDTAVYEDGWPENGGFPVGTTVAAGYEKAFCVFEAPLVAFSVRCCASLPARGVLRLIGADGAGLQAGGEVGVERG